MKTIWKVLVFLIIGSWIALYIWLYINTGFFQYTEIDSLDLQNWVYDGGVIAGNYDLEYQGNSGKCWVMAHGYTSSADELKQVAEELHRRFNDTVYVPLFSGHARVPSELLAYTVDDWYKEFTDLMQHKKCNFILGSSMGASFVLEYAKTHELDGIVLQGLSIKTKPEIPHFIVKYVLAPKARYLKKTSPGGTVDDPEGKIAHISSWTFPLKGSVGLTDFNKKMLGNLEQIDEPVLALHAMNDTVALIAPAENAIGRIPNSEFVLNPLGDHIMFRDYGKQFAIDKILEFRGKFE